MSKPRLVIMDEATSALDTHNEELLYKALKQTGITIVSVGHRPTLTAYHEQKLKLQPAGSSNGDGTANVQCEVAPVEKSSAKTI